MKIFRKVSLFVSCFLFAVCSLLMGLQMTGQFDHSEAITNTDTSSYKKVGEIWTGNGFSVSNMNSLLQLISGSSSVNTKNMGTIDNMAASSTSDGQPGTSAATIRAKTYNKTSSQDVIVTLGGLDWQVVYLSKDTSENIILTLWLSNSTQSAFSGRSATEGEYYGFLNGGLYSDWSANWSGALFNVDCPSSMYGTSYINAVTLNNGGFYSTSSTTLTSASQNSNSVFSKFTMSGVSGSLTQYFTKPNAVKWQREQDTLSKLGTNSLYNHPNENAADLSSYKWGSMYGGTGSMLTGENGKYYYAWADNYLWLPSITETGFNASYDGIWQLSINQRLNYDGSATNLFGNVGANNSDGKVYTYSWLRSSDYNNANYSYYLGVNGISSSNNIISRTLNVRPALHLNLTEAARNVVSEYTFVMNYNGGTYNGSSSSSQSGVKEGGNFNFNVPTRAGYTLTGWKCSYNNKIYYTSPSGALSLNPVENFGNSGATVTFTAQWSAKSYTVIASANGGTISSTSGWSGTGAIAYKDCLFGSTYSTLPTVTRTGYNLTGWFTAEAGGTKISTMVNTSNGSSSSTTTMNKTSNHILYAQWTIKTYSVNFVANGGSGTMATMAVAHGVSTALSKCTLTRSGYVFMGWSVMSNGAVNYQDCSTISCTSNMTLYAIWKEGSASDTQQPVIKDNKYQISSAANLAWLAMQTDSTILSKEYVQTASIDLSGKQWIPIGSSAYPFTGTFDGQGYSISNMVVYGHGEYKGLFGYTSNAILKNIRLSSGRVAGKSNVGGIAGYALLGSISDCVNFCTISGYDKVGGIAGYSSSTVKNCFNYGDVSGNNVGGILGQMSSSSVSGCVVKAVLEGKISAGGIVGVAGGTISSSYYEGTLISDAAICGAIAAGASPSVDVTNCYARATYTSALSTSNYGFSVGTISNCVFETHGVKRYIGADFSNWVVTLQNQPLPKALAWMGVVAENLYVDKLNLLGFATV